MNNKDNDNKSAMGMVLGMVIGTAIGVVAGIMSRMIYLWLPIGVSKNGKQLYTLKVVIDESGNVITAFPKK